MAVADAVIRKERTLMVISIFPNMRHRLATVPGTISWEADGVYFPDWPQAGNGWKCQPRWSPQA